VGHFSLNIILEKGPFYGKFCRLENSSVCSNVWTFPNVSKHEMSQQNCIRFCEGKGRIPPHKPVGLLCSKVGKNFKIFNFDFAQIQTQYDSIYPANTHSEGTFECRIHVYTFFPLYSVLIEKEKLRSHPVDYKTYSHLL
jgi:hypothetical protein